MRTSPIESVRTELFESELIPPLDAQDTWGLPWERQLSALQAWQEAGGNCDGEAGQWVEPSIEVIVPPLEQAGTTPRRRRTDNPGPHNVELTMQTVVRMNTLLVSLRERLLQTTAEASNIAIAEMSLRQSSASQPTSAADPSAPLSPLQGENKRRMTELVRSWFDIMAAAQVGMTGLTGLSPSGEVLALHADGDDDHLLERRQHEMAIDFADRRRAG